MHGIVKYPFDPQIWLEGPICELLQEIFSKRPCLVCGKTKWCADREPRVEIAEMVADSRRRSRAARRRSRAAADWSAA